MTLPFGAGLGQLVYITSVQTNMHIYAVMTDGATPNLNTITVQVSGDESTAIVPAIKGQVGPAGEPQFALDEQPDIISSPSELPSGTLTELDFGKYWLLINYDNYGNPISSSAYVWWGSFFRVVPFGTKGSPGPVPDITPEVILIDEDEQSYVVNTGTMAAPVWVFYIAAPRGIQGPTATIAGCPDFNDTTPPEIGQVIGFNGNYVEGLPQFQPMSIGSINPQPYTVPESAFTSYSGISATNQPICTFAIPPQPWAWKPIVLGQILVNGITLNPQSPLLINAEVLLGDPQAGQLVAKGFGNALGGVVELLPQTSSSSSTSATQNTAMTPTNSTALVPANHTGNDGTLYVNLVNQGYAGVYNFNAKDAQLFVMVVPAQTENAVASALFGSLSPKITLQAWSVTQG